VAVIDARPTTTDLNIYAGDDLKLHVAVTDDAGAAVDLTGYTAMAQVRDTNDGATPVDFTATVAAGGIDLVMANTLTTTLPPKGVWDVQITSATGEVTTVAGGRVTVTPDVTR
jgi:hypothetical protein